MAAIDTGEYTKDSMISGKSTKETAADGSSVEHRDDKAAMKGSLCP